MSYIIYNNNDFEEGYFLNTPIRLNDNQKYVFLEIEEENRFSDYLKRSELQIKTILKDIIDENGNRTNKMYLSRFLASEDPNRYQIFLQDYFVFTNLGALGESIFERSLTYNDKTFTQWFGILNEEGRFFRAVVGSFAIALTQVPAEGGGITEAQRQELDFILRPMLQDVYTGNWRTAAEYYYIGYPTLGVASIKSLVPVQLAPNFALLEATIDSYLARFYTDTNGNPLVINPN